MKNTKNKLQYKCKYCESKIGSPTELKHCPICFPKGFRRKLILIDYKEVQKQK